MLAFLFLGDKEGVEGTDGITGMEVRMGAVLINEADLWIGSFIEEKVVGSVALSGWLVTTGKRMEWELKEGLSSRSLVRPRSAAF